MSKIVEELRSSKERTLHTAALVIGGILWLVVLWGAWAALQSPEPTIKATVTLYISYFVLVALFYFLASAVYKATAYGNMILLGPRQFPHLYEMVVSGSQALGMAEPPRTFLYNSNGLFNAFARRLLGGRYVFLTSALVEAENDEQVRFVIGHELGHHAAGHLNPWLNALKLPAHLVPFLMRAYSRSREYTCDRIGARLTPDVADARKSLQMLGCGCRRLNDAMNDEAFAEQEAMVPPFWGMVTELMRSHPRLTRRVLVLRQHAARDAARL